MPSILILNLDLKSADLRFCGHLLPPTRLCVLCLERRSIPTALNGPQARGMFVTACLTVQSRRTINY